MRISPQHDVGKVIFERQEFIKQTADTVLIKNAGKVSERLLESSIWFREISLFEIAWKRTSNT
jgi:hypothetical protein